MKQKSLLKVLILVLVVAMSLATFIACNPDETVTQNIPEFKVTVVNGEDTIEITEKDVANITLSEFDYKDDSYKGFKISDIIANVSSLKNLTINSLRAVASDGYGDTKTALPADNFENAYIAILIKNTDGSYVNLESEDGPARIMDLTEGSYVKSVKQLTKLYVNSWEIEFVNGEDTKTLTEASIASLELKSFSVTKNDTEYFYKGYKVSEILELLELDELENVESLTISDEASEPYAKDLPLANFENAYFALLTSETADGTYVAIDADDGPVRLYDTSAENNTKSVKNVKSATFVFA